MRVCYSSRSYALYSWDHFEQQQKALNVWQAELFGGTPHIWVDHLGVVIPDELKNTGLKLVMYTPKPYNYSLCSIEEDQTLKTEHYYRNCIDAAATLGIRDLTLTMSGGCVDAPKVERHKNAVSQLKTIAGCARKNSVRLHIAPSGSERESEVYDMKSVKAILDEVAQDNVTAALDTAVMALQGETIEQWFETLGNHIGSIRLRDYDGNDEVPLGEGALPLDRYAAFLKQVGYQDLICADLGNDEYWDDPSRWEEQAINTVKQLTGEVQ